MTNTALITGCSSGIGELSARTFLDRGWNVVATMRNPDASPLGTNDRLLVTRLDVTDPDSVNAAIATAIDRFGQLDVLVNNAGLGGHALLETSTDEMIHDIYDANVFGVMRTCRAAIPHMRAQGSGCLINVTSLAGIMGVPVETAYSSSKFAVEGFSEALYWELRPLGIDVKTVAPGGYMTTAFSDNANDEHLRDGSPELQAYGQRFRDHFLRRVEAGGGRTADPQEVADEIYRCATEETPVSNPVGDAGTYITSLIGADRSDFLAKAERIVLPRDDSHTTAETDSSTAPANRKDTP